MTAATNADRPSSGAQTAALYLGLVVLPLPGKLSCAQAQLIGCGDVELGEAQGHRLPAFAQTRIGEDKALIARLEALPSVLKVEVVFAQILAEDI